jgi:hypothetical protein
MSRLPRVTKRRRWLPTLAALMVLGLGLAGLAVWMNRGRGECRPGHPARTIRDTLKAAFIVRTGTDNSSASGPHGPEKAGSAPHPSRVRPGRIQRRLDGVQASESRCILTVGPEKKTLQGQTYSQGTRTPAKTLEPDYGVKDITDSILDSVDGVLLIPGESQSFGPKGDLRRRCLSDDFEAASEEEGHWGNWVRRGRAWGARFPGE